MTLVATVAAADADSYLTLAAAEALALRDIGPERDAWDHAGPEDREAALRRATREIDGYIEGPAPRVAYSPGVQALYFPRAIDLDDDGDPVIPSRVQQATYQQAIHILANKDLIAAANAQRTTGDGSEGGQAYGIDAGAGPLLSRAALHYLAGFARAPRSGATLRSVAVGTSHSDPWPSELIP